MFKLENNLKEWVSHKFITQDQAKSIRDYESTKPESSWILSGLLILGIVIVGIGVISLIAANWDQIPDSLKLGGDFALLTIFACAILYSWSSQKALQFEVLLLFFLVLCLASIGLISQIYHTGGKLYQALMFWALITGSAALAARQLFIPFMWTGAFLVGIVFTALDSVTFQPLFQKNYQAVYMSVPLLCAGFTVVSKKLVGGFASTRAFQAWTLIGGVMALVIAEAHGIQKSQTYHGLTAYMPGYFLAAFAALGIGLNLEYKNIQKVLLLIILGIFFIPFHLPLLGVDEPIAYAICTVIILALVSVFLASLKERRLFQWFLFILGVRFLVLYFQALGGLATTGFGLILSGGLVIGMAMLWSKYRNKLATWAERWGE